MNPENQPYQPQASVPGVPVTPAAPVAPQPATAQVEQPFASQPAQPFGAPAPQPAPQPAPAFAQPQQAFGTQPVQPVQPFAGQPQQFASSPVASAPLGREKRWIIALLLSIFLGGLGVDRFYMGSIGLGVLKLLTGGVFGILSIIDIILILTKNVKGVTFVD